MRIFIFSKGSNMNMRPYFDNINQDQVGFKMCYSFVLSRAPACCLMLSQEIESKSMKDLFLQIMKFRVYFILKKSNRLSLEGI